jgi:hypothetical protein
MKFTVTYDGPLPACGHNTRTAEKWDIRKKLHPQLAQLWAENSILKGIQYRPNYSLDAYLKNRPDIKPENFGEQAYVGKLDYCGPITVQKLQCIPLVRQSLDLACSLNILFLRKGEAGNVILESGDIDNRLKTLFDGLKMPSRDDFGVKEAQTSPNPLYTVLQSDALINDVAVRTDRLLTKPDAGPLEVRLIIEVHVKVMRMHDANTALLGD